MSVMKEQLSKSTRSRFNSKIFTKSAGLSIRCFRRFTRGWTVLAYFIHRWHVIGSRGQEKGVESLQLGTKVWLGVSLWHSSWTPTITDAVANSTGWPLVGAFVGRTTATVFSVSFLTSFPIHSILVLVVLSWLCLLYPPKLILSTNG